jgi:hypothetical protein
MFALRLRRAAILSLLFPFALAAAAQDTRTVTEPVFPASCTVLTSTLAIIAGEPASETTLDTTRIQNALTACPSGQAVELASSGTNYAFLTGPLNIPSGVTLVIDGGVTLFASRNPADYQVGTVGGTQEACGTTGNNGNGCKNLLTVNNTGTSTGAGIMGYGVIDGRGEDKLLVGGVASTISWWDNAAAAQTNSNNQSNPILLQTGKASNFTLYKITVKNSPMFHLKWNSGTGFTAWGVKVITPYTARNTDGLDVSGTNATIINSSISDGDDDVAISAASAASNITISNTNTYSGHGLSIGSYTQGGFTNLLVNGVNMAGTAADSNAIGLRVKSALDRGGLVQNLTYSNMCLQNMKSMISITPFYNSNSGTLIPQYKNITFTNLNFLTEGTVGIQGADINHTTSVTLNNVYFPSFKSTDFYPGVSNTSYTLGPGQVMSAALASPSGSNVSISGNGNGTSTTYACPSTVFPYVTGDLYLGGIANNKRSTSITLNSSVTLNAMVQPAMSQVNYNGSGPANALTASINFLEGNTVVGTGALGANGTLASAVITPTTTGVHTYTAQYPGDTNYAALNFGSITVTVTGGTTTTTTVTASPASVTYGTSTLLTANIAGTAGTAPTGTVQFYDNGLPLGSTVTVSTVSASAGTSTATYSPVLMGGSHSITAVYSGDGTYLTSTSATAASATVNPTTSTTTLAALPTSAVYGASITLTATVTPGTGTAIPTSSVTFMEGTTVLGTSSVNTSGVATFVVSLPIVATHTYTAAYSGDSNYSASPTSNAVSETITIANSSTTLSLSSSTAGTGTTITLTATVSGTTAGVYPTGSVTFKDGANVLTGSPANLSATGVATLTATFAVGTHMLSAVYGGDNNFNPSTSTNTATENAYIPFTITTNTASVNAVIGALSTAFPAAITLTPGFFVGTSSTTYYNGNATLTCTAPVSYISCNASYIGPSNASTPSTASATAQLSSTGVTDLLTVGVLIAPLTSAQLRPAHPGAYYAVLLPFAALILLPFARRRATKWLALCLMLCALTAATLGLAGCTNALPSASGNTVVPPTGPQTITITATGVSTTYTVSTTMVVNVTH